MCGIIGIIGKQALSSNDELKQLLKHRGPDNVDVLEVDNAIFVHNRLSVIDLSDAANQPMVSDNGRHIIVFNGEIYNYQTLKKELSGLGCTFKTQSDTEVLLVGYLYWGTELLDKLDGMFAFSIWDKKENTLFCARDHVGIKPLFYTLYNESFVYGSELKVIEQAVPNLEISRSAIVEYLIYNYVPAPKTIFADVCKLEPGSYLKYDLTSHKCTITQWWSVPKNNYLDIDYNEAKKLVRQKVSEAVQSQLIADVPIGAFLSGGIDSSIIAAEMAQSIANPKVYTIQYANNDEYDETQFAKIIAKKFGLDHRILTPDFDQISILDSVNLVLKHTDEPYGNPTVIMTNILSEAAKKEVVVGLVGDGADELFGGYPRYRALNIANSVKPIFGVLGRPVIKLLNQFQETPKGNHFLRRMKKFLNAQNKDSASMFQDWTSIITAEKLFKISSDSNLKSFETARTTFIKDLYDKADSNPINSACYADQYSFLPNNLLEGSDRLSMAASFELRVPFVNRELIELAAQLRPEWKIKGKKTKRILKDAYANLLPDEILYREKRGFNPPVWHWLQNNEAEIRSFFGSNCQISKLFEINYIENLLNDFYAHREDSSSHLWALIVLEKWIASRNIKL